MGPAGQPEPAADPMATAGRRGLSRVLLALDQGKFDAARSLDELAALAEANNMQAVAAVVQKRQTPEAATMLGEGKWPKPAWSA